MRFDNGTVPNWVGAVGTVAAFGFAAVVYWKDKIISRDTEKKSQAKLFDAWISGASFEPHQPEGYAACDPLPVLLKVIVSLSNASVQSVRSVGASVHFGQTELSPFHSLGVIPPTSPGDFQKRVLWLYPTEHMDIEMKNPQFLVGGLRLDISFIDSSGIWWDRKAGGTLTARSKATDKALRKKQAAQVKAIEPTQAEAGEIDSPVSSSEG